MGATAMLGHLVYTRYAYGSERHGVATTSWLRRVLGALFRGR
jgi:hypothetical protein